MNNIIILGHFHHMKIIQMIFVSLINEKYVTDAQIAFLSLIFMIDIASFYHLMNIIIYILQNYPSIH